MVKTFEARVDITKDILRITAGQVTELIHDQVREGQGDRLMVYNFGSLRLQAGWINLAVEVHLVEHGLGRKCRCWEGELLGFVVRRMGEVVLWGLGGLSCSQRDSTWTETENLGAGQIQFNIFLV